MTVSKKTLAVLALCLATASIWAEGAQYGAEAATTAIKAGTPFGIEAMLGWAVEDEFLARAEYSAIIAKFGAARPYTNIMEAESQHLSWLKAEFAARSLSFPADGAAGRVQAPADLRAAAQAGVDAELANIAMYEAFLSRPELAMPENASARSLFESLARASRNHLSAFRNQLSKF